MTQQHMLHLLHKHCSSFTSYSILWTLRKTNAVINIHFKPLKAIHNSMFHFKHYATLQSKQFYFSGETALNTLLQAKQDYLQRVGWAVTIKNHSFWKLNPWSEWFQNIYIWIKLSIQDMNRWMYRYNHHHHLL